MEAHKLSFSAKKAPDALSAVVSNLSRHYEGYFPGAQSEPQIVSTSVIHRRLSDVARVRLRLDGAGTEIYIKFHKHPHSPDERVQRKAKLEYETLQQFSKAFASIPGCAVPYPIAYFSEYKAVVTQRAEGVSLYTWVNRPFYGLLGVDRKKVENGCYRAGYWLRKFQELSARPEKARFESSRFREEVESVLQRCETLGFSRRFRDRIGDWLRAELDRLGEPEVEMVGQHPDFHPQNILVSPEAITVLDFTSFRYGNRYHDVACFLTFLTSRLKHPCFGARQIDRLQAKFLQGYSMLALEDPLLRLYCVKAMLYYCTTFLSRMPRSRWVLFTLQPFFLRWAEQRAILIPELE